MSSTQHILDESQRRRTFAIISHPDAGKTTLTEKFLLYSGAVKEAGSVKARRGRKTARSDWMDLEQQRGISITSSALQFEYDLDIVNLLDTPGHRDFSEDTYRVLAAVDAAVMVLDAAKGIEPQTLKLFEVCRQRNIPLLTFINKFDRPGLEALELLDNIEKHIGLHATPLNWPVGIAGDFRGVVDRETRIMTQFKRTARGATEAGEVFLTSEEAAVAEQDVWPNTLEELELLDEIEANFDLKRFLAGEDSPVFFGSALTNFGVRSLLDAVVDLAPSPSPREDASGQLRELDQPFSAFVFKVQANMDKAHRDRIAFLRVCSGEFERGMVVEHARTGRSLATKYAQKVFADDRATIDRAYPGDVIGLVNAAELRIGDTVFLDDPVEFRRIPRFSPELFKTIRAKDSGRFKQFRRGLEQLDEEGAIQVLRDPTQMDPVPLLGAVGVLQFEVAEFRLTEEFGVAVELGSTRFTVARRTDAESAEELTGFPAVRVVERSDGLLLALFENELWLYRLQEDRPGLLLESVLQDN
ncbi:MAG: peptide chain release factor 3 [Acidimicrobiales bacterium]